MIEPLFRTKTEYSFEEFKKYNIAVQKNVHKTGRMLMVIVLLLLAVFFVTKRAEAILGAVLFPVFFMISMNIRIKQIYNSNPRMKSNVSWFDFYDDYFRQSNVVSQSEVKYSDIYEIVETKENIYIMVSVNEGYIIIKENCSKELIEFLRNLSNKNRHKE